MTTEDKWMFSLLTALAVALVVFTFASAYSILVH